MYSSKDFEYVLALAETHNFTLAAKQLYMAQPALSRYIKNLENTLGVELFIRDNKTVRLTQAGEVFALYANQILNLEKRMSTDIATYKNRKECNIKIGIPSLIGVYMLPKILTVFNPETSPVKLQTTFQRTEVLNKLLQAHNLDVAISCEAISPSNELICHQLTADPIYLMAPIDHPAFLKQKGTFENPVPITLNDFEKDVFILLNQGMYLNKKAREIFRRNNFTPHHVLTVPNLNSAADLVVSKLGVAFVHYSMVQRHVTAKSANFGILRGEDAKVPIYLIASKDRFERDSLFKLFVQTVKSIFQNGI